MAKRTAGKRTVLITGAGSGIGLALAEAFAARGDTVIGTGRDAGKLERAAQRLPQATWLRSDIADDAQRAALATKLMAEFPALDTVIHNAGTLDVLPLESAEPEAVLASMRRANVTHVEAPLDLTLRLLPHLKGRAGAQVVMVSSGLAWAPATLTATYSASKAAMHSLSLSLRKRLAPLGVHVVEVLPPAVATDMSSHYAGGKSTVETVARAIVRGLDRGQDEIAPGDARALDFVARISPRLAVRIVDGQLG